MPLTLWVQQPGDAQLVLGRGEGVLQVDASLLMADVVHVHQVGADVVDHRVERNAVLPALAKVFDVQPVFSEETRACWAELFRHETVKTPEDIPLIKVLLKSSNFLCCLCFTTLDSAEV